MKFKVIAALVAGIGMSATASAQLDLGTLPNGFTAGYFTYGNANIYSLPVNNYVYDYYFGGGTGPGSPYYVNSTPGAIKDTVVIYTGSSGQGVTTNEPKFENAYQPPNGSQPTYADTSPVNMILPSAKADPAENPTTMFTNTWDADIGALKTFLDGGLATFLFNNNDTNTDQNLAFWAKLWITDPGGSLFDFNGGVAVQNYLYANRFPIAPYGTPGIPAPGGDPTLVLPQNLNPVVNAVGTTDYILSGGNVCMGSTNNLPDGPPTIVPCDGSGGTVFKTINHNLGANQVAYAAQFPLLDAALGSLGAGYTLHIDLRLGCDPAWPDQQTCLDRKIDNGFEQLFLISTTTPTLVPEPGILALVGLGLVGVAATRRRREAKAAG